MGMVIVGGGSFAKPFHGGKRILRRTLAVAVQHAEVVLGHGMAWDDSAIAGIFNLRGGLGIEPEGLAIIHGHAVAAFKEPA